MSKRLLSGDEDMDTDNCFPDEVDEMAAAAIDMARGLCIIEVFSGGNGCKFPKDVERAEGRPEAVSTGSGSTGKHMLLLRPANRVAAAMISLGNRKDEYGCSS